MKRVVSFIDVFEEVPDNAKYLFSRKVEVPLEETEDQKTARIVSNNPESHVNEPVVLYTHYYEVDDMDFEELVENGYIKKNVGEKMKEFMKKYKIPIKENE